MRRIERQAGRIGATTATGEAVAAVSGAARPPRPAPCAGAARGAGAARAGSATLLLALALLGAGLPAGAQPAAAAGGSGAAAADAASAPTIEVSGFEVSGNTLLPPALIDATLAPFKGRRGFADLERAAAAVQALYARAGWGAVVAYLPPQSAADGRVRIEVVEGKLAQVRVNGAQRLGAERVRASLPALQTGRTPSLRQLDAQLQIANENPSRQLQALLQAGRAPGEVDAVLTVTEKPVQRWTVALDNSGNERTGELRASLGWQHADIGGRDDVLSAQFQTSPDQPSQVKVFSLGYRHPLPAQLLFVDAFAAYSDVDGGSTPTAAGDLRFNGRGRLFGLRLTRVLPRWGEVDQRLIAGLDQRAYLNQCGVSGLGPGACSRSGESVSVQPLSLEYTAQSGGSVPWGLGVALAHNLNLGGSYSDAASFDRVRPGAPPRYTTLRLLGYAGVAVADEWRLQGRFSGQWTNDPLVPGEQFGIGGAASVRGYLEREVIGDRGALLSVELLAPPLRWGDIATAAAGAAPPAATGPTLQLLAFADAAAVDNVDGDLCAGGRTRCQLASVGVGARVDANGGATQARLYLAQALRAAVQTARHKARVHLAISHSF